MILAIRVESAFEVKDWTSSEFGHLQAKEELPPNLLEPRGQGFVINVKEHPILLRDDRGPVSLYI
jgi:hypothetical protein